MGNCCFQEEDPSESKNPKSRSAQPQTTLEKPLLKSETVETESGNVTQKPKVMNMIESEEKALIPIDVPLEEEEQPPPREDTLFESIVSQGKEFEDARSHESSKRGGADLLFGRRPKESFASAENGDDVQATGAKDSFVSAEQSFKPEHLAKFEERVSNYQDAIEELQPDRSSANPNRK